MSELLDINVKLRRSDDKSEYLDYKVSFYNPATLSWDTHAYRRKFVGGSTLVEAVRGITDDVMEGAVKLAAGYEWGWRR